MRTLILVRHAKSSWDETSLPDRDRPLAARGERDLAKMGKRLAERAPRLELILCSPALRARRTAEGLARALGYPCQDIRIDERLYACRPEDLLAVLAEHGAGRKRVMLVGHNPELLELAQRFAGQIERLPTCAVAELRFDCQSWADIGSRRAEKVRLDYPKKGAKDAVAPQ